MSDQPTEEIMLSSMDRVMRLLRRRPAGSAHLGRGVYRLLESIKDNGEISTRELADILGVRPASLNEKLAVLEEKEMVARLRDPKDQRIFLVRLMPHGEAHLEKIRQERKAMNRSIGGILSKEESELLINLTKKLADGLEELTERDGPDDPVHEERSREWN